MELRPLRDRDDEARVLRLERVVTGPTTAVPRVITPLDVRHEEVTGAEYRFVLIHPGGIRLEVQEAH